MEELIPKEQIRSYLVLFASQSHMLGKLDEEIKDKSIDEMHEFITALINNHLKSKIELFAQFLPEICQTCALKYSETGAVTKKEYFYCIRTDGASLNIPDGCPEKGKIKKFKVVNETDDDTILDIRKRYGRK